jgi:hypothetical protein
VTWYVLLWVHVGEWIPNDFGTSKYYF